jgi:hypothetical protein
MQCTCATLSSVVCPAVTYFSTLSNKRHGFRKKKIIEHKMCVLIISIGFVWNISHCKKNWARHDHKCNRPSFIVPVILVRFLWLLKNTQTPIILKIRPMGAGLFREEGQAQRRRDRQTDERTEGRTDMIKLILAFRNFAKAPKTGGAESLSHTPSWPDALNHAVTLTFNLITRRTAEWRFLQTVVRLRTEFQWWALWA